MLRNTLRHLLFIARQLGEYIVVVSLVIIVGTFFSLINTSASNAAAIYENVKTYSFLGIVLVAFIFFNASSIYNHILIQYNLTRRCLFLSTQIGKVLISTCLVVFHQIIILVVNLIQGTPYSITFLVEALPNIALFILILSVGEFAGQITIRLGKFGIILYTLCFAIIGGFFGFFMVADPSVISTVSELIVTVASNFLILPAIYLAGAAVLSTGSYLMHRKVSV